MCLCQFEVDDSSGHDDRLTLDGVHGRVALMLILFQRFFPFVAVRSRAVCVCSFVLTAVAETVVVVLTSSLPTAKRPFLLLFFRVIVLNCVFSHVTVVVVIVVVVIVVVVARHARRSIETYYRGRPRIPMAKLQAHSLNLATAARAWWI
uniref:Uncharacterized protein n=1 Tax=Plectus sambesii TaxID=2011161 RepID=A0A914W2E5_9BILA